VFSPLSLPILSFNECGYLIDLLRKSLIDDSDQKFTNDELEKWFTGSKVTIEVLVSNMVNPEVLNNLFFSHYQ
jgi:hypothetical protein